MINKYQEFINESIINSLLLESNVVYSGEFRKVLSKVDSPIAIVLTELENKDLDITSNYLSIDKSRNDIVSFTPDNRAKELEDATFYSVRVNNGAWLKHSEANKGIFEKLGYTRYDEGLDPYSPSSSDIGQEVSRYESKISGKTFIYMKFENGNCGVYNSTKCHIIDSNKIIFNKNRQDIKIGRVTRALLLAAGKTFADKEIEQFVNSYKSTIDKFNEKLMNFDIVKGEDIVSFYEHAALYRDSGTIGSSCMLSGGSILELYEKHDNVELIIYRSDEDSDKILGRAILWTLTDGKKFMDRIYTAYDSDVNLFREFANSNGIYYKSSNDSSSTSGGMLNGTYYELKMVASLSKDYDGEYPYLDTLKYFCPKSGLIGCRISDVVDGNTNCHVYECEYTNGGYSERYGIDSEGKAHSEGSDDYDDYDDY